MEIILSFVKFSSPNTVSNKEPPGNKTEVAPAVDQSATRPDEKKVKAVPEAKS